MQGFLNSEKTYFYLIEYESKILPEEVKQQFEAMVRHIKCCIVLQIIKFKLDLIECFFAGFLFRWLKIAILFLIYKIKMIGWIG